MNKVLKFFKDNLIEKPIIKNIRVYGWQHEYDHLIISSISKYLFEELNITENIVELNDDNRPGTVKPNKYIVVHDTGDASSLHTAKFWSEAVFNRSWEHKIGEIIPYKCSYQYVVDNEGIYHNLPDEEVAYHAGDGTRFDYTLYPTNIIATTNKPVITISEDGYYLINNISTNILAPRFKKEKDGKILIDRIATSSDINDQSILCKIIDGKYYIGETYFSQGYEKIANRGGNNNSVGIESCITEGTDIYYTWQKTAKLVAKLLDENKLTIDDVKQHHYFSGKNCPQTIRMNDMWEHFKELVLFEQQIREFKKEGYHIELIVNDENILPNGRIKSLNQKEIKYIIRTIKDEIQEELELKINL